MATPSGILFPPSYFDGLSSLWGGAAYIGSAIVAAGLVFQSVRSRPDFGSFAWLLAKVFLIGICTLFIREWLMRLSDIVLAFGGMMGVDPTSVDEKFITFVSGKTATAPDASMWDIIWGTKSIGTAVCYALLWLFGWLAWGVQYVVKLIGDILLTAGWALSPIFLSFFMLRPMVGVAQKYLLGLVALVLWPFGWVLASVVTNAMLEAAAAANLVPVFVVGAPVAAPALTVLLIGTWMLVSSILAPWITTKVFLMGANPAAALAQGVGGVAQAVVSGGVAAGVAAATGGAGAAVVAASVAGGAVAGGAESTMRGGGSPRMTSTVASGLSGLYTGGLMRRHAVPRRHRRLPRRRTRRLRRSLLQSSPTTRSAAPVRVASKNSRTAKIPIVRQSKSKPMINLTRRSIAATEQQTKAVERSTVATRKATNALRELMRAEDERAVGQTKQKPSSGGVTKK